MTVYWEDRNSCITQDGRSLTAGDFWVDSILHAIQTVFFNSVATVWSTTYLEKFEPASILDGSCIPASLYSGTAYRLAPSRSVETTILITIRSIRNACLI